MATVKQWIKSSNDFIADVAKDGDLDDEMFIEVLEHLVESAEDSITAKREEMEEYEEDENGDDDDDEEPSDEDEE